LDRVKEFVPAGNNPAYPDVLVTIRSVRDSLERWKKKLGERLTKSQGSLHIARTVIGALECFLAEGGKDFLSKEEVQAFVDGRVSNYCFTEDETVAEDYFDFHRLDRHAIRNYLLISDDDDKENSRTCEEDVQPKEGESPDEDDQRAEEDREA
jgi:hypothetical protein